MEDAGSERLGIDAQVAHRERAVVQERADLLDRGPGIPPELRRDVTEDVEPGRCEPRCAEVAPEPGVERQERQSRVVSITPGRPVRFRRVGTMP